MSVPPDLAVHTLATLDVSAASGLVITGDELHVIADDELALHVYSLAGAPRRRVPLFPGELPDAHAERKAAKPDLEALALLPDGSLLALGSGSAERRRRGAWLRGDTVRVVDLAPLYAHLAGTIPSLNIEGAAVANGRLRLLQRGNGAARLNAVIDLDLRGALAALAAGRPLDGGLVTRVVPVDLGDLDGVPLSFTDATPRGADLLFAAAAEDTDDPYADGPCAGSVIGVLEGDAPRPLGVVRGYKIEGIAARLAELYLVADADDRSVPAPLLRVTAPCP